MAAPIGRTRWAIAEGYIPSWSENQSPDLQSHETACVLNVSDQPTELRITIYYTDREPVGPYRVAIPARRTVHVRFDHLRDPEPIPHGTPYASLLESDLPVVVQHTRLDGRAAANALLTTIAFPAEA